MSNLYNLSIKNGVKDSETGFFFKASPFEIHFSGKIFHCIFEHNKAHEAVLNIYDGNTIILEVEHPFYFPDSDAESFFQSSENKKDLESICHALSILGIGKQKSFDQYLKNLDIEYKVLQNSFYEVEIQ